MEEFLAGFHPKSLMAGKLVHLDQVTKFERGTRILFLPYSFLQTLLKPGVSSCSAVSQWEIEAEMSLSLAYVLGQ